MTYRIRFTPKAHKQIQRLDRPIAPSPKALGILEETGTLEPGKSADFIAIDRNIFDVPIQEVHHTQVVQRWLKAQQLRESVNSGATITVRSTAR